MLRLEGFMENQKLHAERLSASEMARQLHLDRKTVRKYLREAPREYERKARSWKVDPFRGYLRERWEHGVRNASRLFREIQKRGYPGALTQVKKVVRPSRTEERERAFIRFETAPGEQAQMDWGHFGNWEGRRLYAFALTLCWSRMLFVEFTQRQDIETLLNCMVHAFRYFGGVTATILTDNMKTVVVDRVEGQPRFHLKMLDFASYYGFLPRVCHPYRPQTKGKIESSIRYVKSSFWPPLAFSTLAALNAQALGWCNEANRRVHATTREVPLERFAREGLTPLGGQPDYDTSYVSHRQVGRRQMVEQMRWKREPRWRELSCSNPSTAAVVRFASCRTRSTPPSAWIGKRILLRRRGSACVESAVCQSRKPGSLLKHSFPT